MEKPRLLQGFRDYLPDVMQARLRLLEKVRAVYERYGFEPLDTPALEYAELLKGKYGEDEKLIYEFKDHGGRDVALRYDLTVPLARVVVSHPELPKPFKRYQMGTVWRADSPQAGRFREFMQFDADTVGSNSPLADAEMVAMMMAVLQALSLDHYHIRISHRGVFSALLQSLSISTSDQPAVMRLLDKMDKVGEKTVKAELSKLLNAKVISELFSLLKHDDTDTLLAELHRRLTHNEAGQKAIANFSDIINMLSILPDAAHWHIDLSMVRGLQYYTGIIYEAGLTDHPEVGTIYAGGRYDSLMRDLAGVEAPAVGTSLGVDRLMAVYGAEQAAAPRVVLTVFSGMEKQSFELAERLRQAGLSLRVAYGQTKLGKQLQYADALGASQALLYGEAEEEKGIVLVRDMQTGDQKEHHIEPITDLVTALRRE